MTIVDPTVDELVRIWRTVLRDDSLHADSDLIECGGTSLSAVRVMAHVRESIGRDVDVESILENPTPAALAPVVTDAPMWTDDDL